MRIFRSLGSKEGTFLIIGLALCEMVIFHGYLTSFLYTSPAGYMGEVLVSVVGLGFSAIAS
ncbi:MAG: hypothetical protein RR747_09275, partial [Gordonibacter sp.]